MIIMENLNQDNNKKFRNLVTEIQKEEYHTAVNNFLKNNSSFKSRFDTKEGNIGFRVITARSSRCLVINSDLGNVPECLSHSFEQVFSLDCVEKISIQEQRFNSKNIKNINLIKDELEIDSFPDRYFDLIVVNGLNYNSKKNTLEFFEKIKNFLTKDGCLCLGVENKLNRYEEYNDILRSSGFKINSFWALPSFDRLHYSGRVDDDKSLKWFFKNFDKKFSVDTKYKIIGKFLKILDKNGRKFFLKKFCPSFIFYCYQDEPQKTLEDLIKDNSEFKNLILHPRMSKILYFLLDDDGVARKVITCKPTRYTLNEKIVLSNKIFPDMIEPNEKIIVEKWQDGTPLDRFDQKGIEITMKWLTEFQKFSTGEEYSDEEIRDEVMNVREELSKIKIMKELPYDEWLDEYEDELKGKNLKKTGVHGDFQSRNILIDHEKKQANVIDWDWRFQVQGNPIYDYVWLATNMMMFSNNPIKEFYKNFQKNDGVMKNVILIKNTMKNNLQVELDFVKLQIFLIMRFITIRIKDEDDGYMTYVRILEKFSKEYNMKN